MGAVRYLILITILGVIGYTVYQYQIRDLTEVETPEEDGPKTVGDTLEQAGEEMVAAAIGDSAEAAPTRFIKWTDDEGIVHYTNDPNSIPEPFRSKTSDVNLPNLMLETSNVQYAPPSAQSTVLGDSVTHAQLQDVPVLRVPDDSQLQQEAQAGSGIVTTIETSSGIVLYTTEWCDECIKVKRFLETNKVKFVALDVEKDVRHLRDMLELTGGKGRVPVLKAGKSVIIGYKPEAILFVVDKPKH
jgi:glutaredoxin